MRAILEMVRRSFTQCNASISLMRSPVVHASGKLESCLCTKAKVLFKKSAFILIWSSNTQPCRGTSLDCGRISSTDSAFLSEAAEDAKLPRRERFTSEPVISMNFAWMSNNWWGLCVTSVTLFKLVLNCRVGFIDFSQSGNFEVLV